MGTVMVVNCFQIQDYSALNMVSYFAARSCILIWYTSRITSVIRFCSGHKEARTRRALKIVGFQWLHTRKPDSIQPGEAKPNILKTDYGL